MIERVISNTYITDIEGTCVGIYKMNNNSIVMIDSGRYPSEQFIEWLNINNYRVAGIIHTHLHIDHIANTDEIIKKYGCEAYASIYSNERDDDEDCLRCNVKKVSLDDNIVIEGFTFETLYTRGHSDGHMVIITPDGVAFVGDAIMTCDLLKSAKLPYMSNTSESIKSMRKIKSLDYEFFVASHFGVITRDEINNTVEANIRKHICLYSEIKKLALKPITEERLIDSFLRNIGILNKEVRSYDWIQFTARNRVEELIDNDELKKIRCKNKICMVYDKHIGT